MGNTAVKRRPIRLRDAWRSFGVLVADPERTDQVFAIIRSLTGNSFERLFHRVMRAPGGRLVLEDGRSLVDTLSDLERLRRLPEGTLGCTYARFMDEQGLTARGLVDASREIEDTSEYLDERARVLSMRLRDMHDLWHVTAGYGRDLLGEDALLGFTYAQTRNHGVGFIVVMALFELMRFGYWQTLRTVIQGYRRGRRAVLLAAADWEGLLELPLADVRRRLCIDDPPRYRPLFREDFPPLEQPTPA